MQLATRSGITAGVVLAGASLIVAAPVQAPSPDRPAPAIALTAGFDPIGEWEQVISTAVGNATEIFNHWSPAPLAAVQQALVDPVELLVQIIKDPASIPNLPTELENTLTAGFNAGIDLFEPANPEPYIYPSLDTTPSTIGITAINVHLFDIDLPGKADLLNILVNGLNFSILGAPVHIDVLQILLGDQLASDVLPFLEFSGSPLSGVLWGDVGTVLSPLMQLGTDLTGIVDALTGGDLTTALEDLIDMPANITNAFLNGYGDFDPLPLLSDFGINIPATLATASPEVDLGGLLSPGGSLVNALGFEASLGDCGVVCATFDVPTTAVGPIGSMIEMSQAVAEGLGWNGIGFPLEALLNLIGI